MLERSRMTFGLACLLCFIMEHTLLSPSPFLYFPFFWTFFAFICFLFLSDGLSYSFTRMFFFYQLGGMNSVLAVERSLSIPLVNQTPTLILGMDVSHGSPGRADIPSIAAVCAQALNVKVSFFLPFGASAHLLVTLGGWVKTMAINLKI